MDALYIAFLIVWATILSYIISLVRKRSQLRNEMERLTLK
ncbi:CcmD family protein [Methanohalophilus levihalophilus]